MASKLRLGMEWEEHATRSWCCRMHPPVTLLVPRILQGCVLQLTIMLLHATRYRRACFLLSAIVVGPTQMPPHQPQVHHWQVVPARLALCLHCLAAPSTPTPMEPRSSSQPSLRACRLDTYSGYQHVVISLTYPPTCMCQHYKERRFCSSHAGCKKAANICINTGGQPSIMFIAPSMRSMCCKSRWSDGVSMTC